MVTSSISTRTARRAYQAPIGSFRCVADRKPLKDGSGARCMRRAMRGSQFCSIHAAKQVFA